MISEFVCACVRMSELRVKWILADYLAPSTPPGSAALTRTETIARIVIREKGRSHIAFALKRDT